MRLHPNDRYRPRERIAARVVGASLVAALIVEVLDLPDWTRFVALVLLAICSAGIAFSIAIDVRRLLDRRRG